MNIKSLLTAIGADYELPEDRDQKAKLASAMGVSSSSATDAELTDEERAAWLFESNAAALAAAAKEAGARNVKTPEIAEDSDPLDDIASGLGGR